MEEVEGKIKVEEVEVRRITATRTTSNKIEETCTVARKTKLAPLKTMAITTYFIILIRIHEECSRTS